MIGIYKIVNPKGRVYIGKSSNLEKRKEAYSRITQIKKQPKIYNSLIKYGWENHIFEIIEECNMDVLDEREIYWKEHYLKLFNGDWNQVMFCNLHDAGGGPLSEETRAKIGLSKIGNKNRNGFKVSEETKEKLRKPKSEETKRRMKESRQNVSEYTKNKISKSKKGRKLSQKTRDNMSQSRKGMKFSDEHKKNIGVSNTGKSRNGKPIIQYDLDGNFIKLWDSRASAESFYKTGIYDVLIGKTKTSSNFIWRYATDPLDPNFTLTKYGSVKKPVIQYDLEGNIIKVWEKIFDIQIELGFKNSNISACCQGKQKTAYGFKWEYKN